MGKYVMFCLSHLSLPIREFKRCHNGGGNENVIKRQNNNSARAARFFVHFAVTARLQLENAQFHVTERRPNFLSLCELRLTGRNSAPE